MNELIRRLFAKPALAVQLGVASLFITILGLGSTAFMMLVLNRYVPYGVDATLATLTIGVLIALVLEIGFREARRRLASALVEMRDDRLDRGVFTTLAQARLTALSPLQETIRVEAVRGLDVVGRGYSSANITALLDIPFALVALAVLALISLPLALVTLGGLAASFALTAVYRTSLRAPVRAVAEGEAACGALIAATAQDADTVRAFNLGGVMVGRWGSLRGLLRAARKRLAMAQGLQQSLTQAISVLQGVAIVAVGAVLAVKGDLSVGALVGANILAARALSPMQRLAGISDELARAELALHRTREFTKLPLETLSGNAVSAYQGGIELRDVAFAHPNSTGPLFEHLSLRLAPGSVLAVTGPNGSGKTTLARLLTGLIEPSRGQVLIDGVDLRQIGLEWWRRQIIYLPQEASFVDGSVADNIRAGASMDDADIMNVVNGAGLAPWLNSSPKGLETFVGEGGRRLSPGLRRRLALARALATNGKLAILDDPSDSLDPDGVSGVLAAARALVERGATVIVFTQDARFLNGIAFILDLSVKPTPRLLRRTEGSEVSTHD